LGRDGALASDRNANATGRRFSTPRQRLERGPVVAGILAIGPAGCRDLWRAPSRVSDGDACRATAPTTTTTNTTTSTHDQRKVQAELVA
jgi:hypothetical protein